MIQRSGRKGGSTLYLGISVFLVIFLVADSSTGDALRRGRAEGKPISMLRGGRGLQNFDTNMYQNQNFKVDSHAIDESDDLYVNHIPHPADELLQIQDADGSKSYILGGY